MLDVAAVTGFEWDDGNARKSVEKHSVSQAEAEQVFFNEPLVVSNDEKHSSTEPRYHALGRSDVGRPLHVTFALRQAGSVIRVVSARPMSRRERAYYANT